MQDMCMSLLHCDSQRKKFPETLVSLGDFF